MREESLRDCNYFLIKELVSSSITMFELRRILAVVIVPFLFNSSFADVVYLTDDDFSSVVDGSKNVLVEFYAPW